MSAEASVAWLREQIEGDIRAARIISAGGFEPQRWDTEPPGQVNPAADPSSAQISAAIGQDEAYSCGWVQIVVYERVIGDLPEAEYRDPGAVAAIAEIGRREFDHIRRHDPQDVIADCEAKLGLIEAHDKPTHYCPLPALPSKHGQLWTPEEGPCWTLHLLARAYKHRDGYAEHWG